MFAGDSVKPSWLVNESGRSPCLLCQTAPSINNTTLASVSQPGGPVAASPRSVFFLFIHHHFFTILFFSWKSSVFLITSGLFITDDTLHIALRRYFGVQKKMGFAFTLCSSVLMKREIEGRKAFIFWQNATPGHEYLLLLSDYLLCEEFVKRELVLLERAGRGSLICSGESPEGGKAQCKWREIN